MARFNREDTNKIKKRHTHAAVPTGRVVVVADNGRVALLQVLFLGRLDGHVDLGPEAELDGGRLGGSAAVAGRKRAVARGECAAGGAAAGGGNTGAGAAHGGG